MMTGVIFAVAFVLGALAVGLMGANFLDSDTLALAVTAVIGGVFAIGSIELLQFRRATSMLTRSLASLSDETVAGLKALDEWLIELHPSLQGPVRQRVEGERVALPAPVLTPYLVSLLVMLGLLGTFIGLVETLKGVVVALEGSAELESIRRALTAPMGGLELAFGTSVAGVAASAMLGLMSTISRRDRILASRFLDRKIATLLRRFSRSYEQQETFKALQVQSLGLPAVVEKLDALADRIERMGDALGESLATSQARFHDSARVLLTDLAASVGGALSDSATKNEQVLTQSSRLVGEGIQPVLQEAMDRIGVDIRQGVEDTHRQLSETVQDHLQAISEQFARVTGEVTQAWQDGLQAHDKTNETLVGGLGESFGALSTALSGRLQQSAEQAAAREEQVMVRLNDAARSIAENNETHSRRMLEEMSRLLGATEALVDARREGEKSWLEGHGRRMDELTSGMQQALSALRDEEESRGAAAVERLERLESTVTNHLASLGRALEEPMARLIKVASETPRAAAEVIAQLRRELSDSMERDNRLLEERGRLMAELDTLSKSLAESSAGQSAAIQALVDASTGMLQETGRHFAEQVGGEIAKVSDIADQFALSAVEMSSLGEAVKVAVDSYHASNDKLIDGLGMIESALESANARSDEQLAYYVAQAREVIDYGVMTQKELFDELRSLGRSGTEALETAEVN